MGNGGPESTGSSMWNWKSRRCSSAANKHKHILTRLDFEFQIWTERCFSILVLTLCSQGTKPRRGVILVEKSLPPHARAP